MHKLDIIDNGLQDFIFLTKYARWLEDKKRRETWDEATDRVRDMHLEHYNYLSNEDKAEITNAFEYVRRKEVLPSMRSMQFGGKAILSNNARLFNCCSRHIDSIRAFAEIGFLMLCGTGTGIGVSKHFINKIPALITDKEKTGTILPYTIEDTIEGWADSLEVLLLAYTQNNAISGRKVVFDYSKIRRKGARLKTSGGKAPGYKPLKIALQHIKNLLDHLVEKEYAVKLRPINVYDILMYFADAVLSGGIRRTASIVVFDKDDNEMMNAKSYYQVDKWKKIDDSTYKVLLNKVSYEVELEQYDADLLEKENKISWFKVYPQRGRSNNSVLLLRDELTIQDFENIILKTKEFGEPGFIFGNNPYTLFNPCAEVGFLPYIPETQETGVQFCNLTTTNGNAVYTVEQFYDFVRQQTIIGTLQAGYTNFHYLNKNAKILTEQEALLGNSITGVLSNPEILLNPEILRKGAEIAVKTNEEWARKLGINKASRICLMKPEGTGSLAIGVKEPGCHPAHANEYFRRVQIEKTNNIYQWFKKHNPQMCEESIWNNNKDDDVITWPLKVKRENTILKSDLTAIKHLEIIKSLQQNWVLPSQVNNKKKEIDHNISCTVIAKEEEWKDIIQYLYDNRNYFSAVSFISDFGDKLYKQAPFEKIETDADKNLFDELVDKFVTVDYTALVENQDETNHMAESSCVGGKCLT